MATTKTKTGQKPTKRSAAKNGVPDAVEPTDVLTLAEAAAYLRVSEDDVQRMVQTQGLVGRKIGNDWRFLRSSLQDWLQCPTQNPGNQALLDMVGKFKDDPDLMEITREAYRRRGRPITEDGE